MEPTTYKAAIALLVFPAAGAATSLLELPVERGMIELVLVVVVGPILVWAMRRQDRKETAREEAVANAAKLQNEQVLRRDRLLRLQVKTQQDSTDALERIHDALVAAADANAAAVAALKSQIEALPGAIVKKCNAG